MVQAVVAKEFNRSSSNSAQGWQLWKRPLHDGSTAALLLNRGNTNISATVQFSDLGIGGAATIRDVWARKDLGTGSSFKATLPPHGSLTLKLKRVGARVCDVVHTCFTHHQQQQVGEVVLDMGVPVRFTRPYVQLDCAVGEEIASIDRVAESMDDAANDAGQNLDGEIWRCGGGGSGDGGDVAASAIAETMAAVKAACVGKRTCRVRLDGRRAMAVEGTCK